MNIEEVLDKVSRIIDINIHHFDHRNHPDGYLNNVDGRPIVVVYGEKYSPWAFAIMDNYKITTSTLQLVKAIKLVNDMLIKTGDTDKQVLMNNSHTEILDRIIEAEKFLDNKEIRKVLTDFKNQLTYYKI